MAVLPPPITTTRRPTRSPRLGLVFRDEAQRVDHARQISRPGSPAAAWAQTDAQEDHVELVLNLFRAQLAADFYAQPELHAQRAHQFDFLLAVGWPQLVFGHAIGSSVRPPAERLSKIVTAYPCCRSCAAQASDAGPAPMQATRPGVIAAPTA
jgi:hypothetical protein